MKSKKTFDPKSFGEIAKFVQQRDPKWFANWLKSQNPTAPQDIPKP